MERTKDISNKIVAFSVKHFWIKRNGISGAMITFRTRNGQWKLKNFRFLRLAMYLNGSDLARLN